MTNVIKATLVLQFAIAGVALGQATNQQTRTETSKTTTLGGMLDTDQKHPAGILHASKLIGTEVYNHDGKHLGEINDIVLDHDHKRIGYAVLSYGGIAGLGDKLFAMPHKLVKHSSTDNRAIVSLDEQVLKSAPGFDQSKWPTEANAEYYTKLEEYYKGHADKRADLPRDHMGESRDATRDLDETAQTAGKRMDRAADRAAEALKDPAQPAAGQAALAWDRRVSAVIGANVENAQGDNLGEVYDLVLDWDKGEVRYAVLSYGGVLGIGDKLFAVPINAFHSQPDNSKLVLNVSKDQLKNAPGFDKNQWPNMADPQWTKSVGDFYQQNKSDRLKAD